MKKEKPLLFRRLFTVLAAFVLTNGLMYAQSDTELAVSNLTVSSLQDADTIASSIEPYVTSENDDAELNEQIEESIKQTPAVSFNYKDTKEWQKYKTLRAIGWSFLGGGTACIIMSPILALTTITWDPDGKHKRNWKDIAVATTFYTALAMTVASVPILICAYNYRNKAKKMNANLGISYINTQQPFATDLTTPALALTLNF